MATVIEQDVVVKWKTGEVVFEEPGLNDWATLTELSNKSLDEQADMLIPKIKSVSGLEYASGEPVSLESLKAKKFSARFFVHLVKGWSDAILKSFQSETAEGNEQTGA